MRALKPRALTEDDLVAAMVEALGKPPRALRVGIGDDAAAWKTSPHHLSLLTTDMLVDGVHFRLAGTTPQALGWKALAVNLSDIAAMGGWPTVAVVALGLTPDIDEEWVRGLYAGFADLAKRSQCVIAGGDIVRAPALTLGITVAGEVRATNLRTRAGAKPGDVIAITGPLGLAAAGLRILDAGSKQSDPIIEAYLRPIPRLREGKFLGSRRAVHALMDISDGISTDAARMARASGVDAVLDASALTRHLLTAEAAKRSKLEPLELALNGGDDYELLAAIQPRAFKHVAVTFHKRFGRQLEAVGRFEAGSGTLWLERLGKRERLTPGGYDHLKKT
jgi:thiamine-monophosphate kinase